MNLDWLGDNNKGIAIVRVSSYRQEDGISHETQEADVRKYCEEFGIELVEVVRMIETAKQGVQRDKYAKAIARALYENIRHVLFYMYDREARNMIDVEKNEIQVKKGNLVLHYVRDRKVLHQGSADSDFFMRDMQAVTNKHYSRILSTKVSDAMRKKAEGGWYPSNNVPLGYVVQRLKDENGRDLKRGSIVVPDPDSRKIKWVQREFELRVKGLSYKQIRLKCIEEGLVRPSEINSYRGGAIEKRIHNQFYNGQFFWQGQFYQAKHERVISPEVFDEAQRERKGLRVVSPDATHGVFKGGWLTCALCGCTIVYDPKKKVNRHTGAVKVFHYYHCTDAKRMHGTQRGMNVPEEVLWEQFGRAVDAITISSSLAAKISEALNDGHRKAIASATALVKSHKESLQALNEREDRAYDDMISGVLDQDGFRRQVQRIRADRSRLQQALQAAQAELKSGYRENVQSTLELAKSAKSLYLSRTPMERREFLELILSNPVLDGVTIRFVLKKPFGVLSIINQSGEWRTRLDEFRTDCASFHGKETCGKRATGK